MTAPILSKKTDNGRYYAYPGASNREVPSITNIKDKKAIDALKFWAAGECGRYASENIEKLSHLDTDEIYKLVKSAPFTKKSSSNQASLVGDIVHNWIDDRIRGYAVDTSFYLDREGEPQEPPRTALQMWRSFQKFESHYKPEWVMSEFTVWSDRYGYAGTMDWAARINGALVLGDHKTGKGIYADTAMQLAAGQFADFVLMPDPDQPNGYREVEIPKFDKYAILHLRPRYFQLAPVENIEEAFKAFLGCKAIFDWETAFKESTILFSPKIQVRAGEKFDLPAGGSLSTAYGEPPRSFPPAGPPPRARRMRDIEDVSKKVAVYLSQLNDDLTSEGFNAQVITEVLAASAPVVTELAAKGRFGK